MGAIIVFPIQPFRGLHRALKVTAQNAQVSLEELWKFGPDVDIFGIVCISGGYQDLPLRLVPGFCRYSAWNSQVLPSNAFQEPARKNVFNDMLNTMETYRPQMNISVKFSIESCCLVKKT